MINSNTVKSSLFTDFTDVLQTSLLCKVPQNLYENTYDGVFGNKVKSYRSTISLKNNTLSQILSGEFWNIFQTRVSIENIRVAPSDGNILTS